MSDILHSSSNLYQSSSARTKYKSRGIPCPWRSLTSLRSRRLGRCLEVWWVLASKQTSFGVRSSRIHFSPKKKRASPSRAPVLSFAHYFQAPATQATRSPTACAASSNSYALLGTDCLKNSPLDTPVLVIHTGSAGNISNQMKPLAAIQLF